MITIDLTYYNGVDAYSDGDVEEDITNYIKEYGSGPYEDIFEKDHRWPVFYHLSQLRGNIVNWYPFKDDAEVLEIGAGMGAITGILCDKAYHVTAVELSKRRGSAIALRHQSRDNLTILVGDFNDIQFTQKYDYITLIGVLEYIPSFSDESDPICTFLNRVKSLLKPDGKLLIAIENRYGIKYWCGAPEDHTGKSFFGINEYPNNDKVITFSKSELIKVFERCHLYHHTFYYPFPDYKLPLGIFSDMRRCRLTDLIDYKPYFTQDTYMLADEVKSIKWAIENGIFEAVSNSFLVDVGMVHYEPVVYSVKFNALRKQEYQTMVFIEKERVVKRPASIISVQHLQNEADNLVKLQNMGKEVVPFHMDGEELIMPFIQWSTLDEYLNNIFRKGAYEEGFELIQRFFEYTNFGRFLDLDFRNCFYEPSVGFLLYDQEWDDLNASIGFIRYRAINNFLIRSSFVNPIDADRLFSHFGITTQLRDQYAKTEEDFTFLVLDEKKIKNIERLGNSEILLMDGIVGNRFVAKGNQLLEIENMLQEEKIFHEKLVKEKREAESQVVYLKEQLALIHNSRSWKLISWYRNIRDKYFSWIPKHNHTFTPVMNNNTEEVIVTVIIPIYNRTKELIESIESILGQTFQAFELLLICDGSPEETLQIVRRYEENPKIRAFYYSDNSGNAVRGRNKGLREAQGIYVAFQDSDDIAMPDRLALSIEMLERCNADVVYGGWRALLDGTREVSGLVNGQEVFSPDCDLNLLSTVCVPCQSTVMARTQAVRSVGGLKDKMRYREDHELWARLAVNGYTFKSIPHVLCQLRLHEGNLELEYKEDDGKWFELFRKEYRTNVKLKPKVVFLVAGTGISGGLLIVLHYANYLYDLGYDVTIATMDRKKEISWFERNKVPVVSCDVGCINIDVLIATFWLTEHVLLQWKAKRKLYFIQSNEMLFNPDNKAEVNMVRETLKPDYEYIAVARWIQEWLRCDFNIQSLYVPNSIQYIDYEQIIPICPRGSRLRVLIEGPYTQPIKGVKEAFSVVEGMDCEVWYVSSDGIPEEDLKIDRFFHRVPHSKMPEIYASCDIMIKMSKLESFCLPILEMMQRGGAVIVAKFLGVDEFVEDGYNALVVNLDEVDVARKYLKELLDNSELRERLGRNGRETAAKWVWESGKSYSAFKEIIDKDLL